MDLDAKLETLGWHGVAGRLVVGTMCHCDGEDTEDHDHWQFFVDPVNYDEEDGILSSGRLLNKDEMEEIAWLVAQADGAEFYPIRDYTDPSWPAF